MGKRDKYNFEELRNYYLSECNYYGACFFQALYIKTLKLQKYHLIHKKIMQQEFFILDDLMKSMMSESNDFLTELLLEIAGFTLVEPEDKEYRKSCERIEFLFPIVWEEYGDLVLTISMRNIMTIKGTLDEEVLTKYIDNTLMCLRSMYGCESRVYAQFYLHFIYETNWEKIVEYKDKFIDEYQYFKKYLERYDLFYVSYLFQCLYFYLDEDKGKYDYWIKELKKATEANKAENEYSILVCQYAYLKALEYEKGGDSKAVVSVLSKVISSYIYSSEAQNILFYVYILQKAAYHCSTIFDFDTMVKYTKRGIAICEELGEKETELYYEIYNYIGIKMISDKRYIEAQQFYAKNCKQIEKKFGRSCSNYIIYTNNFGLIYLLQGRLNDAYRCFDDAISVEGDNLEELKRGLVVRNLYLIESMTNNDQDVMDKYVQKYLAEQTINVGISSDIDLKILWLSTKLTEKNVDFSKIDQMLSRIHLLYRKHEMEEDIRINYEFCIVLYQWRKGRKLEALKLYSTVIKKYGNEVYSYNYGKIAITLLKLLVDCGQFEKAKVFGEKLIDYRYDEILEKGIGDITSELTSLKMVMSYYICLIDKYLYTYYQDNGFCISLIERIVNCKTLEKDIRSFLGKYESKQKEIDLNLYKLHNLNRKVNALEMRKDILSQINSDESEKQIEEIDQRIFQYTMQIAELESQLQKEINLKRHIKKFEYEGFHIPDQVVAMEFFSYLDVDFQAYDMDYDSPELRYICFALLSGKAAPTIYYAGSYNDQEYMLQEYYDCFFNGEEVDDPSIEEIKSSFERTILPLVEPYIVDTKMIYWCMDAEMHLIPIEWVLGEKYKDKISIFADSLKYIRNDERLNVNNVSSLIMGNPKYAIEQDINNEYDELHCSEIECREVAKIVGGKALIGEDAKQQEFNENYNRDILHISTHGKSVYVEDIFLEKNKLKHIHILLAGYSDWCAGRTVEEYGNGVITADDISYTDMRNTKLAVVAACLTNFSNVNVLLGNVYGLRWALGIAGVHFSVTALWEINDVATSIFMVLFYRYLIVEPIGVAFYMAKNKLRNIRREEINNDSILRSLFEQYDYDEKECECPFQQDKYWAGFTCYCS